MRRANDLACGFWRVPGILRFLVVVAWANAVGVGLTTPANGASQHGETKRTTEAASNCSTWPLWVHFSQELVQADGRFIDHSTAPKHSPSEGQSYSMFFALVASDRDRFYRLWRCSVQNLVVNDANRQLSAWQWGQRHADSWALVEGNSAFDANLGFVYGLIEAGRLWGESCYLHEAKTLLERIAAEEATELPGFGLMLLPAHTESPQKQDRWRLNSNDMPLSVLRRHAQVAPNGPWQATAINTVLMRDQSTTFGFAADWVIYQAAMSRTGQFPSDKERDDLGSCDEIRTCLWTGMVLPADALRTPLLTQLGGMARALGSPPRTPQKVQVRSASLNGAAPVDFSTPMPLYLSALSATPFFQVKRDRVKKELLDAGKGSIATCHDNVLSVFSTGWDENRYRLLPSGTLKLRLETACPPTVATR